MTFFFAVSETFIIILNRLNLNCLQIYNICLKKKGTFINKNNAAIGFFDYSLKAGLLTKFESLRDNKKAFKFAFSCGDKPTPP